MSLLLISHGDLLTCCKRASCWKVYGSVQTIVTQHTILDPPIQVATIGLSPTAMASWAGDARLPYFASSVGRTHHDSLYCLALPIHSTQSLFSTTSMQLISDWDRVGLGRGEKNCGSSRGSLSSYTRDVGWVEGEKIT